jgi:hypothetical protein
VVISEGAISEWVMADLVREVCFDVGDGPLLLGGALAGYRAFADALGAGARFPYMIVGVDDPAAWEAGSGTLDGEGRLVREPMASSAGGGAVSFAPGEKRVGLVLHSGWIAAVEGHGHGLAAIDGLGDALAGKQDASAGLDALAGLATTGFGRGWLERADAAAGRVALELGSIATQAADNVAIAGGAATGLTTLGVSRLGQASAAQVNILADPGQVAGLSLGTGSARWMIGRGSGAESGGDAGSDFILSSYADNGSYKATPLSIARASGAVTMTGGLTVNGTVARQGSGTTSFLADRTTSNINSVMEFRTTAGALFIGNRDGTSFGVGANANLSTGSWMTVSASGVSAPGLTSANAQISGGSVTGLSALGLAQGAAAAALTIDSAAGQYAGISLRSGTGLRWTLRKSNAAESGSNAGSDLVLHRHDDSGTAIGAAWQVQRSSGNSLFDGHVAPLTDNARTMGLPSQRWSVIHAASGTINTSDAQAKCDVGAVPEALLDAWGDVQWRQFRFVDAVAAKGEDARWHVGLVAQAVRDAIDARMGEGAAVRLGLLCHDAWPAEAEERDAEGVLIRPARAAGARWGLRYEECLALEAAWQRRRIDRIEALLAGGGDAGG